MDPQELPQPVILTRSDQVPPEPVKKRNFFTTFGLLFSGWLFGNFLLVLVLFIIGVSFLGKETIFKIPSLIDQVIDHVKLLASVNN